jgi:hypothetical protein
MINETKKKASRQGKRALGTELVSFNTPRATKKTLQAIAASKGCEFSQMMRSISASFIRRHQAALKKGAK